MEDLSAHAQGLAPALGAHGHDHELLDVHVVGGVRTAIQNVHHGHGQGLGVHAAQIAVQGQAQALGGCLGAGQGSAQNGVGAQTALVGGTVQLDEELVDVGLVQHVQADEGFGDLFVHVLHGLLDTLAQVTALVAVPQLTGLIHAGGSTGGHSGPAHGAVVQIDLYLHGRVAAGVQDLPAQNVYDLDHLLHDDTLLLIDDR